MNTNERTENPRIVTYQGYTLVDITNTGVTTYSPDLYHRRNQQRNWETVLQILSMRTQVFRAEQTSVKPSDVKVFDFGAAYTGKHQIWTFEFDVEFIDAVPLADFEQVPVIVGLDETAKFPANLFFTSSENKNIYFKTLA